MLENKRIDFVFQFFSWAVSTGYTVSFLQMMYVLPSTFQFDLCGGRETFAKMWHDVTYMGNLSCFLFSSIFN